MRPEFRRLPPGDLAFPPRALPWSFTASARTTASSAVVVDTNGDLTADTELPGTSNFAAGRSPENISSNKAVIELTPCCEVCHAAEGHEHCYYPSPCYSVCEVY